jgi:hypothetical protein
LTLRELCNVLTHRTSAFADAAPIDHRGHRTPQTQLLINERDKLLMEAARFFPGASDREIARRLRIALARYRDGRWRRDRSEATCPVQHQGKLMQTLWCLLKTRDAIPRTFRAIGGPSPIVPGNWPKVSSDRDGPSWKSASEVRKWHLRARNQDP